MPGCSLHGCCRSTLSSQIAAPARASCPTHLERAIIASGEDLVARHRQRAHCVSVPRQRLLPLHRLIEAERRSGEHLVQADVFQASRAGWRGCSCPPAAGALLRHKPGAHQTQPLPLSPPAACPGSTRGWSSRMTQRTAGCRTWLATARAACGSPAPAAVGGTARTTLTQTACKQEGSLACLASCIELCALRHPHVQPWSAAPYAACPPAPARSACCSGPTPAQSCPLTRCTRGRRAPRSPRLSRCGPAGRCEWAGWEVHQRVGRQAGRCGSWTHIRRW